MLCGRQRVECAENRVCEAPYLFFSLWEPADLPRGVPGPGRLAHKEDAMATKGVLESPLECLPLKISLECEPLDLPFLEDKNN